MTTVLKQRQSTGGGRARLSAGRGQPAAPTRTPTGAHACTHLTGARPQHQHLQGRLPSVHGKGAVESAHRAMTVKGWGPAESHLSQDVCEPHSLTRRTDGTRGTQLPRGSCAGAVPVFPVEAQEPPRLWGCPLQGTARRQLGPRAPQTLLTPPRPRPAEGQGLSAALPQRKPEVRTGDPSPEGSQR